MRKYSQDELDQMLSNGVINKPITVQRKDGSVRQVYIVIDEATDKYCFFNMTSMHVCKCRFDTPKDALMDLYNNENVLTFFGLM